MENKNEETTAIDVAKPNTGSASPTNKISDIHTQAATKIAQIGTKSALDIVVNTLVTAEVDKRATALKGALAVHSTAKKEYIKADKPDMIAFDTHGNKVESFSKTAYEARDKAYEKIEQIERAVKEALDDNKWEKIYKLTQ